MYSGFMVQCTGMYRHLHEDNVVGASFINCLLGACCIKVHGWLGAWDIMDY